MKGQLSLTLCWRSFWRWGRKHFTLNFAYQGSQWSVYDNAQLVAPQIMHDTWLTMVTAPLTLNSMMGLEVYCTLFCLGRKLKIPLWLTTTYRRCGFPGCMNKNRWLSVDTHFHNGAERVLQSVLTIKVGKNFFMTYYNLSEVWFPWTHDQQFLTLRWRSFSWWGWEGVAICLTYKGWQKVVNGWVQPIGDVISQDAWPKFVDFALTIIFMMG